MENSLCLPLSPSSLRPYVTSVPVTLAQRRRPRTRHPPHLRRNHILSSLLRRDTGGIRDMTRSDASGENHSGRQGRWGLGIAAYVVAAGSIFRIHFLEPRPQNYRGAALDSKAKHRQLNFWMLNHQIVIRQGGAPSLPMTEEHIGQLVDETRCALTEWPF